ncbi:hypothetical protein WJX84_010158 [Apatococcus fuscideae]|uniref:Uncharacterized protein n=1 Tax=Apatococcus fuscideae TaxID=2026836 RepID=A0AAW1SND2_9CHLO
MSGSRSEEEPRGEPPDFHTQADDFLDSDFVDLLAPSPGPFTPTTSRACLLDNPDLWPESESLPSLVCLQGPPLLDIPQQLAQGQAVFQQGHQQISQAIALSRGQDPMPPASFNPAMSTGVLSPSQGSPEELPVAKRASSFPPGTQPRPVRRRIQKLAEPSFPEVNRANKRWQNRSRRQYDGNGTHCIRSLIPQQELDMADCLQELACPESLNPNLFEPDHPALRGIATARGMHMFEVADLKKRHLQDVKLHQDWDACFNMGNKCLLDIYTAFAASDLSFEIPLMVDDKRQCVSLAILLKYDLCELYMQTIAGLADFAPHAFTGPDTPAGRRFSQAACQCMAMTACLIETPGQIARLADNHLMKHAARGQHAVSGVELMRRLDDTLSPAWKHSITNSQRHQAHLILQANGSFTAQLTNARQQILDEMQQAIQGEARGPQLLPSRVLMLSDHAHTLSQLISTPMAK